MSGGQVKNSMLVYFSLTRTSYLVTGQVKILMYLPGGQVKIFRFFLPLLSMYTVPTRADRASRLRRNNAALDSRRLAAQLAAYMDILLWQFM